MKHLSADYWELRWQNNETGWDIGYVSPPLKRYFDQLESKQYKILIPGAGNAHEAEYLFNQGFTNVHVADFSESAINNFLSRNPTFPKEQALVIDFFKLKANDFDLIIEQTFFCALNPDLREDYLVKMKSLLKTGGKLVGLLFHLPEKKDGPPYGGELNKYLKQFENHFKVNQMDFAKNSIKPRLGTELFFEAEKYS